jgi:hypothetical protein
MNTTTKKYIDTSAIENEIEMYNEKLRLLTLILPVLKSEKDKTVTKRLATKLQKALDETDTEVHVIYYPDSYGSKEIKIYGAVLKYDYSIDIRFSPYGDIFVCKSEKESIQKEIDSIEKQLEYIPDYLLQLEKEKDNFSMLCNEWATIHETFEKAIRDFHEKNGRMGVVEKSITYVTRKAIEKETGYNNK